MAQDLELSADPSLNRLIHGGRSQKVVLPGEKVHEWLNLVDIYREEYDPQSDFFTELVIAAAEAHWILKRNQKNLHKVQCGLPEDPCAWTPEHHHQIALFNRYLTTAERSFARASAMLRSFQKDLLRKEQLKNPPAPPAETPKTVKSAKQTKPAKPEPLIYEQWIEVQRNGNEVVTEFIPSNDELEQMIDAAGRKPDLIYRRLFFPVGVPELYGWTRPRIGQAELGGLAVQRLTLDEWRNLLEKERLTGHVESTGLPGRRDWRDDDDPA